MGTVNSKFSFPATTYYEASEEVKQKIEEFINDMEENFFQVVSANFTSLEVRDQLAIGEVYQPGRSQFDDFQSKHLRKWETMQSEDSNNPMYPLVECDEDFEKIFNDLKDGKKQDRVNEGIENFYGKVTASLLGDGQLEEEIVDIMKTVVGHDWYARIQQATSLADFRKDFAKKFEAFSKKHPKDAAILAEKMKKSTYLQKLIEPDSQSTQKNKSKTKSAKQDQLDKRKASSLFSKYMKHGKNLVDGKWLKFGHDMVEAGIKKAKEHGSKKLAKLTSSLKFVGNAKLGPISTVSSIGINAYYNTKRDDVWNDYQEGKVVRGSMKTIVGTGIDTVSNLGIADGVIGGMMAGGPFFALIGGAAGGANQFAQFIWPKGYEKIKSGAFKAIDWTADQTVKIGKSVKKKYNEVKSTASKAISNTKEKVDQVGNAVKKKIDKAKTKMAETGKRAEKRWNDAKELVIEMNKKCEENVG